MIDIFVDMPFIKSPLDNKYIYGFWYAASTAIMQSKVVLKITKLCQRFK